jgi:hypothetical protein
VRDIDDVQHDNAVDAGVADDEIEITEWRRVGRGRTRHRREREQDAGDPEDHEPANSSCNVVSAFSRTGLTLAVT